MARRSSWAGRWRAIDLNRIPAHPMFESEEAFYATLFHELAHSTGHSSRLNRGLDTAPAPFGSPDYSKEELVAEMASAFLCGHTGIDPATIDNAAAYLQGWISRLRDDKRLIIQAGGKAQRATDLILGRIPPSDAAETTLTPAASQQEAP